VPGPNAERDARIAAAARLGQSHESIAREHGISRTRVTQIVNAANPQTPEERQRAEIAARLRSRWEELEKIVRQPPAKTTSIGRTVTAPGSGLTVRDMQVVVAAIREQGMIEDRYRGMFGLDISTCPPSTTKPSTPP
jgi:hypothetical protein